MHAVTEAAPNSPLVNGLALGLTFTDKSDLIDDYDNFIHWYIVPDDRAFLPLRTVYFPKSEDKFGVHGSYGERVGRNQYTPRVTASTIRRFRLMSAGAKIRTFDDGWDQWGFGGTHYHGDQDDFLMRSPRSKYWINGVPPIAPCPGVSRPRFGLRLAMTQRLYKQFGTANLKLQLAMQFNTLDTFGLKLAMIPYTVYGTEAAFKNGLKLAMFAKAHVTPAGATEFRMALALEPRTAKGKEIALPMPLQLSALLTTGFGTDAALPVPLQLSTLISTATGKEIALPMPLQLAALVSTATGKEMPWTMPLQLAALVKSGVGTDAGLPMPLHLAALVSTATGKDIAWTMPLQLAAVVKSDVGTESALPMPLQIAALVNSAVGTDGALPMAMQLSTLVKSASGPEVAWPMSLQIAALVKSAVGTDEALLMAMQLSLDVASVTANDKALAFALELAMQGYSTGGDDAAVSIPLKLSLENEVLVESSETVTVPLQLGSIATLVAPPAYPGHTAFPNRIVLDGSGPYPGLAIGATANGPGVPAGRTVTGIAGSVVALSGSVTLASGTYTFT